MIRAATSNGRVCMPNILLKSIFRSANHRLNLCHVNAGAIHPKIDEFRYIFEDVKLDIIVVSETWFKSYRSNASVKIDNYEIIRNDRYAKRGGGVAIYLRKGLNYKVVASSQGISSEYLFIEIIFPDSKILLGAYYKAPNVDEVDVFESVVSELATSYDDVIILGDFNENQFDKVNNLPCSYCVRNSCSKCRFSDSLDAAGLKSIGTANTHFPDIGRNSMLDLFLTNRPEKVLMFNQISHGLSKHDMIFGSYSCNKRMGASRTRFSRNFSKINIDSLFGDLSSVAWNPVFTSADVNVKTEYFNDVLSSLQDRHAPLLPAKKKVSLSSTKPWFNDAIKRAIIDRDLACTALKNGSVTRQHYTQLRNAATNLIKRAKASYLQPKLDIKLGSKAIWQNLRSVGVVSSNKVEPCFTADEYNSHLTSASHHHHRINPSVTRDSNLLGHNFSFRNATSCEVARAINSIKSKAIGLDNISIVFVKIALPFILPVLTHIVNYCLTSSSIPKCWKLAKIIPNHKKTRSRGLDDFRPLSILPCLSKVLEILAKEQLVDYLQRYELIDRFQSSYRAKHSTETVLLHLTDHIRKAFERKQLTVLLLLDFTKAFDTIQHSRLLEKLRLEFGFSSSATMFVRDYLMNRMQCVTIDGHTSQPILIHQGIPQGSVLGPLIFSLYINSLPSSLKYMLHHMFADDVQLYYSCTEREVTDAFAKINDDIAAVCSWAGENGLLLNAKKTQAIVFTNGTLRVMMPNIVIHGVTVNYSDNVRNLGAIMDVNLSFGAHARDISAKVFSRLRSLWPNHYILSWQTRMMLVKSLILPLFTYCGSIYSTNLSATSIQVVERAFAACVRFVFGIRRRGSISEHLYRILGCSIMEFLKFRSIVCIFKLLAEKSPGYLYNNFQPSRRSSLLIIPRHTSSQYNKSFFVKAVSEFNLLPNAIKQTSSLASFKRRCFEYLTRR